MIRYSYPDDFGRDSRFQVSVNGEAVDVFATNGDAFVHFGLDHSSEVEVHLPVPAKQAVLRPTSRGVSVDRSENSIRFEVARPGDLMLDLSPFSNLFFYIDPPVTPPARPDAQIFRKGLIHDAGVVELRSGESVFLEAGAVVRGQIYARNGLGIHIGGRGILDGDLPQKARSVMFENCREVTLDGLLMIRPTSWMVVIGASSGVVVSRLRQIGHGHSTDGIDVVGSQHVRIHDCMLRNGDDCIAVKSLDLSQHDDRVRQDFTQDVEDVRVERCAFFNDLGGTAMEIGHELRCDLVRNIRFTDIDVMGVHRFGAVFGIHNADHAIVSDVEWDGIRVEHHYDRLVSLRVVKTRWSRDSERGQVRNIRLKNVDVKVTEYNPGYTHSLIGGYDGDHLVQDVSFENFRLNGVLAQTGDEFELYKRYAHGVRFS